MKPIFAKILDGVHENVFLTKTIEGQIFSTEFHFHKECQLTLIIESSGKKIIGDCVQGFEPGEVTFLGSDLPHVWHNNLAVSKDGEMHARSITLFLNPDKLVQLLKGFIDTKKLEIFLQNAKRGFKLKGATKNKLKTYLFKMADEQGIPRLITFLSLLEVLMTTCEYDYLASNGYVNTYQTEDNKRIDEIFKYLFSNFSDEIKLHDIAEIANMSEQAFCRFFKARTQKTLMQFVNDIRIAHAIKLISRDDVSIAGIAYDCGYNTISNFNKFFKLITNQTPSEYKRKLQ